MNGQDRFVLSTKQQLVTHTCKWKKYCLPGEKLSKTCKELLDDIE